jgi:hypothetical protein
MMSFVLLLDESVTTCQFGGIKIERPEINDILSKRFCMIHDGRGLIHAAARFLGMKVFSEPAFVTIRFLFHGAPFHCGNYLFACEIFFNKLLRC